MDANGWEGFASLVNQKVILQRDTGDETVDVPGVAEAINALGVLFKPKGKSMSDLVLWHEVDGLELDDRVEVAKIGQKRINPVEPRNVKQHLVDRHGWHLSEVNGLSDDEAVERHDAIHSGESAKDLGHRHGVKPASPAVQEAAVA